MKFWRRLWIALTGRQEPVAVTPAPEVVREIVREVVVREAAPAPPASSQGKRGRPPSSLLRTMELLRTRPDISAREVSKQLSVTQAYARTLLKRAQTKLEEESAASITLVSAPAMVSAPALVSMPKQSADSAPIADLQARLDRAEKNLAALCSSAPSSRGAWNLNRRAEVLRLARTGMAAGAIAGELGIPGGEVDFILKIDNMLQRAG